MWYSTHLCHLLLYFVKFQGCVKQNLRKKPEKRGKLNRKKWGKRKDLGGKEGAGMV